jgi:hypothetical protein
MTTIQRIIWELDMDYAGHPYYVTGNAILHALSSDLSYQQQQALRCSHGVFSPGEFGRYPDWHHRSGTRPGMGSSLPEVSAYQDLFLTRRSHQPWLLDSRHRDALNTPALKAHEDHPLMGRRSHVPDKTTWYVHAYLHADGADLLPLSEATLNGLQFGGARNYGYGITSIKDTDTVDLSELDYSWIHDADSHVVELITPYVLSSDHPQGDTMPIPWWWDQTLDYRRRQEKIVEQRELHNATVADHGQITAYEGNDAVATAKNGVERVGVHQKYGFGELMIRPT